ncbi:MAG: hypothetical protein OK452_10635, partial [Thaumarchaeota archaeon]|nr:hypothetical protein [Nitrososphaerota archaeon]
WQPNGGLTLSNVAASENFLLNAKSISSVLAPKYFVDVSYLKNALSAEGGNYTGGIITDPKIPTIPITIPGFNSSGTAAPMAIAASVPAFLMSVVGLRHRGSKQ